MSWWALGNSQGLGLGHRSPLAQENNHEDEPCHTCSLAQGALNLSCTEQDNFSGSTCAPLPPEIDNNLVFGEVPQKMGFPSPEDKRGTGP